MDHNEAIRFMAAEKYVLDELEPEARDAFEEHFFQCPECALDVKSGIVFREQCRVALREEPMRRASPVATSAGWARWFKPAVVAPAMALLLVLIGIQAFVVQPRLRERVAKLETPQALPFVSLINVNTRGVDRSVLRIRAGEPFLVFVDIPPDQRVTAYEAVLKGPEGTSKWTLAIPAAAAKDTVAIRVPPGIRRAGSYTLIVRSTGSNTGDGAEVGRYPFELQLD